MQNIVKTCDKCQDKERVTRTIDNPKPATENHTVKVPGIGKSIEAIDMDLCLNCHAELLGIVKKWLFGETTLPEFMKPKATDPVTP